MGKKSKSKGAGKFKRRSKVQESRWELVEAEARCVVCGVRFGVWCVVCGVWCVVCGV